MKRFLFPLAPFALAAVAACAPGATDDDAESSESANTAVSAKPYEGTCSPGGQVCAYFAPTDMPLHAIVSAIKGAQQSIRIATYNINIREIASAIRERLAAGVKVELMEDFAHAVEDEHDASSVWKGVGEHPNLIKYKLPVLRGGTPQMHDKILVVDGARVFFGSANWTYTGLAGNFENVMSVKEPTVVKKYEAELDELKALAKLSCETFATPVDRCGKGGETFAPEFEHVALEGFFKPKSQGGVVDDANPECKSLVSDREGFLLPGNQPRIADATKLKACFVDPAMGEKYAQFAANVSTIDKYVDGTAVKNEPPTLDGFYVKFPHRDTQTGPYKVYFGGEDDVEWMMLRELKSLEQTPGESFAYLSTNFLTNSRLVKQVAKLKDLGVRTRVFFDRGRFNDPNFHSQFDTLSKMGFTFGLGAQKLKVEPNPNFAQDGRRWKVEKLAERETEESLAKASVSVFDNDLSGNFGCNHNKFAVLGKKGTDGKYRIVLLNGSANWSAMAMQQNDENLVVVEDQYAASIYLREMISQMYVYRYGQDENSAGLQADMDFVSTRVPCFGAVMGKPNDQCLEPGGQVWRPAVGGALVMAVKNVPAPLDGSRRLWVWVSNWQSPEQGAQPGRAFELFSASTFEGKWVGSIPYAPGTELRYKLFTAPGNIDPNRDGLGVAGLDWEYGGMGNDRRDTLGSRPVLTIRNSNMRWGNP
jgi:phosphatidylserine/phosphatidylglycerophosphate/cardiolipin synthase-like enzyme